MCQSLGYLMESLVGMKLLIISGEMENCFYNFLHCTVQTNNIPVFMRS